MNQRLLLVAVLFPILGLMALIGRAELNLRNGRTWELPISGYDPRDLLSGHYLRYQYRFQWLEGATSCGNGEDIDPDCCLCLQPRPGSREPLVHGVRCEAVEGCLSWLRGRDVAGEQRYFVPAERAAELEHALRDRPASLRVAIGDDATLAVDTLLLDGAPWQGQRIGSSK